LNNLLLEKTGRTMHRFAGKRIQHETLAFMGGKGRIAVWGWSWGRNAAKKT